MRIEISDDLYEKYLQHVFGQYSGDETESFVQLVSDVAIQMGLKRSLAPGTEFDELTECLTYPQLAQDIATDLQGAGWEDISLFTAKYLCIDVVGFKHFNDYYGLTKGNEELATIAQNLRKAYPENKIYRFGGEEFLVNLVGAPAKTVEINEVTQLKYTILDVVVDRKYRNRNSHIAKTILLAFGEGMFEATQEMNHLKFQYPHLSVTSVQSVDEKR